MYWSKTGDDTYEVLDGQQRTISISQYVNKDFAIKVNGNNKFYQNLTDTERKQIEDYELTIYICEEIVLLVQWVMAISRAIL